MRRQNVIRIGLLAVLLSAVPLLWIWVEGLRYPIVSDTAIYALLGESLWQGKGYVLFGLPYAKHLPLHAVLSYPLAAVLGYSAGLKFSALLSGIATILLSWSLFRRRFGAPAAVIGAAAVALHPGLILMTVLGSADLLFTALFLATVLSLVRAEKNTRWYLFAGFFAGVSCLARYNGVPLLPLIPVVAWLRPGHLRSRTLWLGVFLGMVILSLWFLRNALTFGDPFHTDYTGELGLESKGTLPQLLSNVWYYLNPVHNVFPFFVPFMYYGLWKFGRREKVLIVAGLASLVLTSIWWVQAIRFAFPAIVLLLGFSAAGLVDIVGHFHRKTAVVVVLAIAFAGLQGLSVCVYASGRCNAAFDRTIGIIPKSMGLTSEGFHAWDTARNELNRTAEAGATVYVGNPLNLAIQSTEPVYRSDLTLTDDPEVCPVYRIGQSKKENEEVLFQTEDSPVTYVLLKGCH